MKKRKPPSLKTVAVGIYSVPCRFKGEREFSYRDYFLVVGPFETEQDVYAAIEQDLDSMYDYDLINIEFCDGYRFPLNDGYAQRIDSSRFAPAPIKESWEKDHG